MNTVLWILQGLLALVFLGAGVNKLIQPKSKLVQNPQFAWANDFSQTTIKTIAGLEVLGALGLILPGLLGVAEILTPLAAVGLALIMAGATYTHLRRGERANAVATSVLLVLAAIVAILRFGPYPL